MSGSRYSEEEIEQGLTACVLMSGNTRRASDLLIRAGERRVPHTVLWGWINKGHAERYRRLQEEMRPEFNARMAESHEALAQAYSDLQYEAIEKVREKLPKATVNQAVGVIRAASIGAGINTDKALVRRGQPTEIRQTLNVAGAMKKLEAIAPGLLGPQARVLIGEATEIKDEGIPSESSSEEE